MRNYKWQDHEDATMLRLHDEGYSAELIGRKLSRPRCSIIGRLFRLKKCNPEGERFAPKYKLGPPAGAAPAPKKPKDNFVSDGTGYPVILDDIPGRKTFWELDHHDCKWPIGNTGFFCAAPISTLSYCARHYARSVGRVEPDTFQSIGTVAMRVLQNIGRADDKAA